MESKEEGMFLSVVIPAFNEAENLPKTVPPFSEALIEAGIPHELILVNDNSTDETETAILALAATHHSVRLVRRRPPGGFGRAVRSGLAEARGDVIAVVMADLSDQPADLVRCYRMIEQGYDCVFGSRWIRGATVKGYPLSKRIVNRIANKLVQWLFWCPFNDLTNAFKVYRRHVIDACGPYRSSHFNITLELSLSALMRGYQIKQIPIDWMGRTAGISKLRLGEMCRRYLATLLKSYTEKLLIADDLIAERLAMHALTEEQFGGILTRLEQLEAQIGSLLPAEQEPIHQEQTCHGDAMEPPDHQKGDTPS